MSDDVGIIHDIFGVDEAIYLPTKMHEVMLDKDRREEAFSRYIKEYSCYPSVDGFHDYYMAEQAERKTNKQDFTPNAVSDLVAGLTGSNHANFVFEPTAGTGGMMIRNWWEGIQSLGPLGMLFHKPSSKFYWLEELSDRAIPFLLFNAAIRGINAVIVHGDSLSREVKNIYFVQNTEDEPFAHSSINVMPRTDEVRRYFNVDDWVGEPLEHIEDELELDGIRILANS